MIEVYLLITVSVGVFIHFRDSKKFTDYVNLKELVKNLIIGLSWPIVVARWVFTD